MNLKLIAYGLLALAFASSYGLTYLLGHNAGSDAQAVHDQKQFDAIDADLARQKADANKLLLTEKDKVIAALKERDQFKTSLEKQRADKTDAINAERARYDGKLLQFRTDAGCGAGGEDRLPATSDGTLSAASALIQLPGPLARDLRQILYDADQLAVEYRTCYDFTAR